MSGALIVGADITEDLLMLCALFFGWLEWCLLQDAAAVLMTLASSAKWLGFIPAAWLIFHGAVARPPRVQPLA